MYSQSSCPSEQDVQRLIEQHGELVNKVARHLLARLPANVSKDDLIQAGMLGLIEAAKRYDANKGASFATFASIRIKGAMLDEIRRGDWVPRSVHRNTRKITQAIRTVENRIQSSASDADIAEELGVSLSAYHEMLKDTHGSKLFSFSELAHHQEEEEVYPAASVEEVEPLGLLEINSFQDCLATSIKALPEREQLVLALYYQEELNLKEIGHILEVSESRVSQIHTQAAMRLRAQLQAWQEN